MGKAEGAGVSQAGRNANPKQKKMKDLSSESERNEGPVTFAASEADKSAGFGGQRLSPGDHEVDGS